jgi:hypothetical protein
LKVDTLIFNKEWVTQAQEIQNAAEANIVFVFGDSDVFKQESVYDSLKALYPNAHVIGSSSSGNILGKELSESTMVASAVRFEKSRVAVESIDFKENDDVKEISMKLVQKLPQEGLKHIFLISDGLNINGSELVKGVNAVVSGVSVTGGMAGDGARFQETWVLCDDVAKQNRISVVGFYGEALHISSGCFAGWSEFGTDREITKSVGNVLYEIDGEPALDLYKRYLGEYASDFPNSGLRFPLSIKEKEGDPEIIRTLLGINEEEKSITFAGNVPTGFSARLMKPDIDTLIDGAGEAAKDIEIYNDKRALGLVVSCVGRKIVMDQLVDEELESIGDILGENVQLIGFYSYGEIAPFVQNRLHCELHNQTMTLTVIYEE